MTAKNENVRNILARLPETPGVYRMMNADGETIYVGKSVNLKSRVSSYFNGTASLNAAKRRMVEAVTDIETISTRTGTEALVLETNLIKEARPKYNVLMKDDKDLAYLRIDRGIVDSVEKTRVRKAGGTYFGPYPSGSGVAECLVHLRKLFKVRSCRMTFESENGKPRIVSKA